MRTRKQQGINAAAWFYAQPGFHGNIEAPKPAPQPKPAAQDPSKLIISWQPGKFDGHTRVYIALNMSFQYPERIQIERLERSK